MKTKRLIDKTWFRYIINTIGVGVILGVVVLLTGPTGEGGLLNKYLSQIFIPIGFNIILAVSLNLTAGFLGQLPLGHAGFMSIGAYSAALFSLNVNLPTALEFPLALIVGGIVAAIFGILIGLPALRLKGDYLAIITLGFGEIIRVIILNLPNVTGGAYGLKGIPKETTVLSTFVCVVITLFLLNALMKSRHGRAILSIREDEIAAEASGIPTTFYKVTAFSISAFFAGIAGGLYAHYLSILDASNFGFMRSTEILVMVVLGGLGSTFGSVIAATGLTVLPELLRGFDQYRMVIYSLLLVIVMIFKPSGLFGRYDFSLCTATDNLVKWIRGLGQGKKKHTGEEAGK
jgi:ABC-type branched-chain amino acid transport system, permease component